MPAFNPAKPVLRYQLLFEGSWPTGVAFLGSGHKLAASNQRGEIFLWNLPEKPPAFDPKSNKERLAANIPPVRKLEGHTNEISRLLATADGKHLISSSFDRSVRIWPVEAPAAGKADVILDSDTQKREARRTGKKDEKPKTISVETQTECQVLAGHDDWVFALALSKDGKRILSGDAKSNCIVWDSTTGKQVSKFSGQPWNWIVAAAFAPDGQSALVSEYVYKRDDFDIPPPALKIRDIPKGTEKLDLFKIQFSKHNPADRTYGGSQLWRKFIANGLIAAAWSPDGKLLALGQGGETDTGKVHLLDAETGKLVRSISGHQYGVCDLLFTADSKHLISVGRDTTARIGQVADGKEVAVLGTPRGGQFKDWFSAVALSPDERHLAVADIAGLVQVWEFTG